MGWFLTGYAPSKEEEKEDQRIAWIMTQQIFKKEKPEKKEKKTKTKEKKKKK